MRLPGLKRLMRIERPGAAVERAVDDELHFHFDMTMRELMNAGLSADDARREAERRFGDVRRARARMTTIDRSRLGRDRRAAWWSALSQEMRYAARGLRLKPGFTAGVVVTLGLGIGANAAMFGIVDRLLFRAPPYLIAPERAHRLYFGKVGDDGKEWLTSGTQYQLYRDLSRTSRTMDVLVPYTDRRFAVGVGESARELHIGASTADFWKLFTARPVIGRFFSADDDTPSAALVVVLAYKYWQTEYGAAANVLGKTITIGPSSYTIIGVAPPGFAGAEMVAPMGFIPITAAAVASFSAAGWERYRTSYHVSWLEILGRSKIGVSPDAATADISGAFVASYRAQIAADPRTPAIDVAHPRAIAAPINQERGPRASSDSKVATWLLGVASIVLLIACANVSNLLLARAFSRRREIAVRIALGVSRARLMGQLFIESMLLAILGGAVGLVVAQLGGRVLNVLLLRDVESAGSIADARVLAFAGLCAIGAAVLSGLAPIVQAGRSDVAAALKASAREGHGQRSVVRSMLLIIQAALSVVLLVGAGLFVRSVDNVRAVHLGMDVEPIVWIEPHLRGTKLDSVQEVGLIRALLDRARANPAVEDGSIVVTVPRARTFGDDLFGGIDSVRHIKTAVMQVASPGYFATMRTKILRGRGFTPDDRSGAPLVAVVSEGLARVMWPSANPIGQCVRQSADTMPCRTVVGVAEDVTIGDISGPPTQMFYFPAPQSDEGDGNLMLRVRGSAVLRAEALRRDLQHVMPGAGYVVATPLTRVLEPATRSWRLGATMFAVFGLLALALSGIGLYSVVSYAVTQRTHEMGVRIALGARVSDVISLVVRDGVGVIAVGIAIGATLALAGGRWIEPLLFKVSPKDPAVFTAVALVLIGVAISATWVPARRAARVDPARALRAD